MPRDELEKLAEVDDGWKPRLRGNIYCSRRCGGNCTKRAFDRATKEAAELATRMGDGWTPRVWENLGWHYSVEKGVAEVHAHVDGDPRRGVWKATSYWANILTAHQFHATAKTPEDALGYATQEARTAVSRINGDLADIASDAPKRARAIAGRS